VCMRARAFHFTPHSHTLGELKREGSQTKEGQSPVVQLLPT